HQASSPLRSARAVFQQFRRSLREPAVRELAPVWLCVNAVSGLWLGPTLTFLLTEHRAGAPNAGSHRFPLLLTKTQRFDGVFAGDPRRIGWIVLAYAVLFAIGVTGWSFLLPRMNVRTAMRISLSAMLPVCIGFFLVNHSSDWSSAVRWTVGCATALLILVESGFTPAALTWLATALGTRSGKGGVMGMYSLLLSLGAIIGSLLAGWLGRSFRFDGLLLGTVLLAVVGLFLLAYTSGTILPTRSASA
ncbi:MAG: MFS transporter, partial [Pseudomonadota bacterium]|nr:MFS transporter [Pseudomonadota bacterium]